MKNEWHIPQNGWHVAYPTINKDVFLVFHTDKDTIHVSASKVGFEVPLIDIPKNRLHSGGWSMLLHLLQLAIGREGEHD